MPAAAKMKSREASSCRRRFGRSTSRSCPFHLRTLPATITVSTLVRSISETTAPGTWLSGATLIRVASRMMMSASLPGVSEPVLPSSRRAFAPFIVPKRSTSRIVSGAIVPAGGGVFQMPASATVMHDPSLGKLFETYWQTPQLPAVDRLKLFKLVWELVGSEFAGRHQQYEKFYAGASFIVRSHNYRETDWTAFNKIVEDLMASYGREPAKSA